MKLLTCQSGHFWEEESNDSMPEGLVCPECGAPAEGLPMLEFAPSEPELPRPIVQVELELLDEEGRPNISGYEISETLKRGPQRVRRYVGRQIQLNRPVLIEVVLAKEDAGQLSWGALRGQASALGKLSHPNIVQIHDTGQRDRQIFFNAIELIEGPNLVELLADKPLPTHQAARLVELLARAISEAHEKGLLHRNLRPSVVLLQLVDGPLKAHVGPMDDPAGAMCQLFDKWYIPKLTGFGLTKKPVEGEAIDAELFDDELGHLSPEQAWGKAKDIAPWTDVHGLGGILYWLLTNRAPHRGPSYTETLDAIQSSEVRQPSLVRWCPRTLESVCRKSLSRVPRRRYATAAELAEDLRRVRQGQVIAADRATFSKRVRAWIARSVGSFILLLLLIASVVVGLIVYYASQSEVRRARMAEHNWRERFGRADAEARRVGRQAARIAEVQAFLAYKQKIDRAGVLLTQDNRNEMRHVLANIPQNQRGFEWHYLMARAQGEGNYVFTDFKSDLVTMAISPNGTRLATAELGQNQADRRGPVRLFSVRAKDELVSLHEDLPSPVTALAFAPQNDRLAMAGPNNDDASLFRLANKQLTIRRKIVVGGLTDVGWTPDGNRLILARRNGATVVEAESGREMMNWNAGIGDGNPQGCRLAIGPGDSGVVLYSPNSNNAVIYTIGQFTPTRFLREDGAIAYALGQGMEDGAVARLATGRTDGRVIITTLSMPAEMVDLGGEFTRLPLRLAFSPDARRLAVAYSDRSVRVWALAGPLWMEVLTLPGWGSAGLAFANNGRALAAAGGREAIVWGMVP